MKKSLVALAVLAASGAVLAQVKVTGKVVAGFQDSISAANVRTAGLGVDEAEVVFSATEDLGGGMKASAKMGIENMFRGAPAATAALGNTPRSFGSGDSEVALSGDFGKITLSTTRGSEYLTGGVAGVGGTYMDGRVFSTRDWNDRLGYSYTMGSYALSLTYSEPNYRDTQLLGLGLGTSGTPAGTQRSERNTALGLRYTDGPLVADVGYTLYDLNGEYNEASSTNARGSFSYDFGFVKLGAGMTQRNFKRGTRVDTGVAANVPFGAFNFGINWAERNSSDRFTNAGAFSADNGITHGYGLKAAYSLSKRTSVSVDYTNWEAAPNANAQSQFNMLMSHSF